jgi:predicted RNase H-like HicB family nuclease
MVAEMTYRAVYERGADGRWTVAIPKVKGCHTYGRTIDQARDRIREALGLFVNNAETARIEDHVRMPAAVKLAVRNARQSRQQLEAARGRVSAAELRAVRYLRQHMKLGHRDAGSILGLSHQRVHQLERQKTG